jgi:hypothetical protein
MAWHEDQEFIREGYDYSSMIQIVEKLLPIIFKTQTVYPIGQGKLFVVLNASQRASLNSSGEAAQAAKFTLNADSVVALRGALDINQDAYVGYFKGALSAALKLILPGGWVAAAVSQTVKTLVGYLVVNQKTQETAAFLSASLEVGGELREMWHMVKISEGKSYFYREIQYEVKIGAVTRQFVIFSTRYALLP